MTAEKRLFQRIGFPATVAVTTPVGQESGQLRDISLNGALVHFSRPPELDGDRPVNLEISLPAAGLQLQMKARCVHCREHDYGFRFIGIEMETMGHLRRLLELNTGDSSRISRELDFLLERK